MENIKNFIRKQPLISIMIVLCCISCFAILSATPLITKVKDPGMLWIKQLIFYAIATIMIYIINKIGNDQIYDKIWIIYGILMVLLIGLAFDHIVHTKLLGRQIVPLAKFTNGATSWYKLPGFDLQPSEFMKIAVVILLAKITKEYNDYVLVPTFDSEMKYIGKCLGVVLPPAFLIYLQNDTGVVLILLMGFAFVLFSSGLRQQWFTVGLLIVGFIVVVGAYLFFFQPNIFAKIIGGHKLDRFYGWVDPEGTYGDQGFQLFNSILSYGTAGLFGHGFQAVVKTVPEAQTDFIFAIILTDYGFVGGLITISAVVTLDVIILKIGLETTNHQDKFFTMGIFGMLIFQQVWNMSMILGLLPITGITLPFISYGGSSLLSYMIAIGMLIDINNQNDLIKNKQII